MSRRAYLLTTAVIFALIALLHLVRIVFGWSAVIGGWSVPMWLSWVAHHLWRVPWLTSGSALRDSLTKRLFQLN